MRTVLEALAEEAYSAAAVKAHQRFELVKQMVGSCRRCEIGDITVSAESFATRICPDCAMTMTVIYTPILAKQEKLKKLKKGVQF